MTRLLHDPFLDWVSGNESSKDWLFNKKQGQGLLFRVGYSLSIASVKLSGHGRLCRLRKVLDGA